MLKIGCHVKMNAPDYILGSVKEALSYGCNALMLYTGAPQNTMRVPTQNMKIEEAKSLLEENGIALEDVIVHAPYIINCANVVKKEVAELAKEFVLKEMQRTSAIGAKYMVLHPGSYTSATLDEGITQIANTFNTLEEDVKDVMVCFETMAGKGSEIGKTFEELAMILEKLNRPERFGICLDTCHIHDAGYDLTEFDKVLDMFDHTLGLSRLHVVHLNDSKNEKGSHKDRHANLGDGYVGFDLLNQVAHHPKLTSIVKILETPYIDGKPPYALEIEMLKKGSYYEKWKTRLL